MSFREFYAALYARFPPEEKPTVFESSDNFFSEEELQKFRDMEAYAR